MTYTNQRIAYGETLVKMGKDNPKIVVMDADLCASTMGKLYEIEYKERHYEMGIAEANMLSVAAGLSTTGRIPFANSFAVFVAGRAYDQIRQTIAIGKLNVKIVGSSAGLSDFGDGATHQSIEDMAIMGAIPNMTVICPADANETVAATKAIAKYHGPVYMRLNRNDYDNVTEEGKPFVIGEPDVLLDGKDVVVFATGYMVGLALKAAKLLADEISVKVVNVATIKPLPKEKLIHLAKDAKVIVTAEEHSVIGGLGSVVLNAFAQTPIPIEMIGLEDVFGCSAHNYDELLEHFNLTDTAVADRIKQAYFAHKE
ncbi:MAG: transketolase family protein [Lachnospiraceae bacterium]|nr:transketolase family protein [Lachnospiraceae bacterium]